MLSEEIIKKLQMELDSNYCASHINKEDLYEAIQQLYLWQHGSHDSFTTRFTNMIFLMFQKADSFNILKMARGFPEHFIAYKLWYESETQREFFKYWNMIE